MGSPTYPTDNELQALNTSSQIVKTNINYKNAGNNTIQISLDIPTYAVAILDLQY